MRLGLRPNLSGFATLSRLLSSTASVPPAREVFLPAFSVSQAFADGSEIATARFVDVNGEPEQRLVAQSITGRWHVIGSPTDPVRVVLDRPFAFEDGVTRFHQANATYGTVAAGTGRYRNGAMINPTILHDTADMMDPLAPRTAGQGFDNYMYQSGMGVAFSAGLNAHNGAPIEIGEGVLVQSIGLPFTDHTDPDQAGGVAGFRTKIVGHFLLTVVPEALPEGFLGVPPSGHDKTGFYGLKASDVNLSLLPADDPQLDMPSRRTFKEVLDLLSMAKNSWSQDQDRSRSMMAEDQRISPHVVTPETNYSREMANRWGHAILICVKRQPTTGGDAVEHRNQLVYHLCQDAIDYYKLLKDGCDFAGGGGFQTGFKALIAFAAILMDHAGMKAICNPILPRPFLGGFLARDSNDLAKGYIGYGLAEHKRYVYVTPEMVGLTGPYYPVTGRSYPIPYQSRHVGIADWHEFGTKGSEGWRIIPNWNSAYKENCLSDMAGTIGVHLLPTGPEVYNQPAAVHYFDRAIVAKRKRRMKSEAGFTAYSGYGYDKYRDLIPIARINMQPDMPDPPILTAFPGDGSKLGVRLANECLTNGATITGWGVRFRTTQPDRYLENEPGWTEVTGISLSTEQDFLLDLPASNTQFWVQIFAESSNGRSPYSTNLRAKTSARTTAEAYTSPRGVATTSVDQPISNTTPPYLYGGASIGSEVFVEHGDWIVPPTGFSYQWRMDEVEIPGATARTYVRESLGALTCQVVASNSTSSLSFETAAQIGTAQVTRSVVQIASGIKSDTTATLGNRTRELLLGSALGHPVTPLVMAALVPASADSDVPDFRGELRNGATLVSGATSGNDISGAAVTASSGNLKPTARLWRIPSLSAGADRVEIITNTPSAYDVRQWAHALAVLQVQGFDWNHARFGLHRETIASSEVELYDEQFVGLCVIGQSRVVSDSSESITGTAQIVSAGSLILSIVAAGPHYAPQFPEWSSFMTPLISGTPIFTTTGSTLSLALGYQPVTGPLSVECAIGGNPVRFAMSTTAVPPL
jgi:hypothetical protein